MTSLFRPSTRRQGWLRQPAPRRSASAATLTTPSATRPVIDAQRAVSAPIPDPVLNVFGNYGGHRRS